MTEYNRPALFFNRHIETIYPALFRKVTGLDFTTERITTPDQDFLDVDWYVNGSKQLVILSHGLEGNSKRGYVRGMARAFLQAGFDVLAWNFRGCSGEMNRAPRFYHSGATDDLDWIVQQAIKKSRYHSINLVGFSLGANLTLKYLGENHNSVSSIRKAVAISVPLNLDTSCTALSRAENWMYEQRFLRSLKSKVKAKAERMPLANANKLASIKTIRDFDNIITGPLHGFKDAPDYYLKCSSIHFLPSIKTPTLILNARNDPFLSSDCYPDHINRDYLQTCYPRFGGHVGFTAFNKKKLYWSEIQALQFVGGDGELN